jgi:hypothetical protein
MDLKKFNPINPFESALHYLVRRDPAGLRLGAKSWLEEA